MSIDGEEFLPTETHRVIGYICDCSVAVFGCLPVGLIETGTCDKCKGEIETRIMTMAIINEQKGYAVSTRRPS